MAFTLRRKDTGKPVGAGDELTNGAGVVFVLDNWSGPGGGVSVYAYPKGHTPRAPIMHFRPEDLGLYYGSKSDYDLARVSARNEVSPGEVVHRFKNVKRYVDALNRLEIAPNGDDFNAVLDMLEGAAYRDPHEGGR